jgi:hypothetical protein
MGLLFEVVAETLRGIAADPKHLGTQIGLTLVQRTWESAAASSPIRPRIIAIPHRRNVIRRFIGRLAPSRRTATGQILIWLSFLIRHQSMPRYPPSWLVRRRCSRCVVTLARLGMRAGV